MERANKKANRVYGVPILNVYNSLRHSWACQRLNAGFLIQEISAGLGHTSTKMTEDVYAQYQVGKLSDVIKGKKATVHRLYIPSENSNQKWGQVYSGCCPNNSCINTTFKI